MQTLQLQLFADKRVSTRSNGCEQSMRDAQRLPAESDKEKIGNEETRATNKLGHSKMTTPAIWLVYTLMFGYPVPTLSSPEFTNETSCQVYLGTLDQQVVKAFQLVCSRDHA